MSADIKEWMAIAEKYGAKFDNVELVPDNGSFTVRAIDKGKEFHIKVPFPVLLPEGDMEITDETHRVRPGLKIPDDLRKMLNEYLDFILSPERVAKQAELIEGFAQMPEALKNELVPFGFAPLAVRHTKRDLKVRLIQARTIYMNGARILMPFIDFMNHSFDEGRGFQFGKNSIFVKGKSSQNGEIFAIYNTMVDPFAYLQTYYFVPRAENALGMTVTIRVDNETQLTIGRNMAKLVIEKNGLVQPDYCVSSNIITLPVLWLGSHKMARNPFWSFKRIWEEHLHRTDTIRIYSILKSLNLTRLVNIVRLCDSSEQSITVKLVKECALQQLTLIGEGFEEIVPASDGQ